jgi:hypothetical protein
LHNAHEAYAAAAALLIADPSEVLRAVRGVLTAAAEHNYVTQIDLLKSALGEAQRSEAALIMANASLREDIRVLREDRSPITEEGDAVVEVGEELVIEAVAE